ncbi:uncharacterized protein LOC122506611 [Leptopilina heterotoma]|uniref:uncharacterized protein LOC122506611 n=1 Tax=Leptopilina heterotoma TaxID=63436 RepID=UPI001CA94201|nr:uncharacterized protein LOC122506611 [Leptopilina heterotoma]XP_043474958.1 uncharacterized protein LOC122506611 [Leptopilina heterotoma]
MAQGKLKVKTKTPASVKTKASKKQKGPASQRRGNAPIQSKKAKFQEAHRLKKIISKTVNTAMENELREKAMDGKMSLTNKKKSESTKK